MIAWLNCLCLLFKTQVQLCDSGLYITKTLTRNLPPVCGWLVTIASYSGWQPGRYCGCVLLTPTTRIFPANDFETWLSLSFDFGSVSVFVHGGNLSRGRRGRYSSEFKPFVLYLNNGLMIKWRITQCTERLTVFDNSVRHKYLLIRYAANFNIDNVSVSMKISGLILLIFFWNQNTILQKHYLLCPNKSICWRSI